jgi:hypothetical protein
VTDSFHSKARIKSIDSQKIIDCRDRGVIPELWQGFRGSLTQWRWSNGDIRPRREAEYQRQFAPGHRRRRWLPVEITYKDVDGQDPAWRPRVAPRGSFRIEDMRF